MPTGGRDRVDASAGSEPLPAPGGYRRAGLRAFCARRDATGPEAALAAFRRAYGGDPDATLESGGWIVLVGMDGSTHAGADADGRVQLVLHGEIHDPFGESADALARRYRVRGKRLFSDLNGSHALIVLDRDSERLMVVTDRVSTRRIFWSRGDGGHYFTSDLNAQPLEGRALDPVGIAWCLTNGACHAERTLYEGVEVLRNAHIHEVTAEGLSSRPYWSHWIVEPDGPVDHEALVAGMAERLEAAVARRATGDLFLSLSGGYDSTAIACILVETLGIRDVETFSYVAPDRYAKARDRTLPLAEKDAGLAARTAGILGLEHRILDRSDGDFLGGLRRGAARSEGVATSESDDNHWVEMAPRFAAASRPALLVGSEYLGPTLHDVPGSVDEIWTEVHFRPLVLPPGTESLLPDGLLDAMVRGVEEDKARVVDRQAPGLDLRRLKDQMVLDHRVIHAILPWRERHAAIHAAVRYPYHDAEVLDWVTRVPFELRLGKRLFLEAARRLSPTFRAFERTEREGSRLDRARQMRDHEAAIRTWLAGSKSRFDDLVPLAFTTEVFERVLDPSRARGSRSWAVRAAAARAAKLLPWVDAPARAPASSSLFSRLAALRMALERD